VTPYAAWNALAFIAESNKIEGIARAPTAAELDATEHFTGLVYPSVADLVALVAVYQPDAVLRDKVGLNVRVGGHIAPPGGIGIVDDLNEILRATAHQSPWATHVRYENLHPFTDGNGRSGRALWRWHMRRCGSDAPLGFLHHFYYQTLQSARP